MTPGSDCSVHPESESAAVKLGLLMAEVDFLKSELEKRDKLVNSLEWRIADLSAEVQSLRAGRLESKEGENLESVDAPAAAPAARASPMAQEDVEGPRSRVEDLNGELERLRQERKQSRATR